MTTIAGTARDQTPVDVDEVVGILREVLDLRPGDEVDLVGLSVELSAAGVSVRDPLDNAGEHDVWNRAAAFTTSRKW